jgi:S1-C subfamily serine protease
MSPLAVLLPWVLAGSPAAAAPAPAAEAGAARPATCTSRYADTLTALRAAAREREARPAADYVHCLRATAFYEHLSFGRGGKLRHEYFTKVRHGTGFVYRARGRESLIATNQHVVAFPEVTGDGAELEGVPPGSRRVRAEVRIVESEAEPDAAGQLLLSRVVEDETLDLAVLAAPARLPTLPYRVGRSRDVRVGDAVLVRGFPLGAFAALNAGRVIGTGQRDLERGWDHEDFAIDALLNLGSSGSPVLAVSCETGDPELVGIYHAGYRGAQGLNVVIGIDQLVGVLDRLVPSVRPASVSADPAPDLAAARAALANGPILMPFGGRTVRVERVGEGARFSVLDASYPLSTRVEVAIVDRGGALRVDGAARTVELRAALWEQLDLVLRFRRAEAGEGRSAASARARLAARIRDREEDQADLLAAVRVGADDLVTVTTGEWNAASSHTDDEGTRRSGSGKELVLPTR